MIGFTEFSSKEKPSSCAEVRFQAEWEKYLKKRFVANVLRVVKKSRLPSTMIVPIVVDTSSEI